MTEKKFSFGTNPSMREVPPGTEAKFSFNGLPTLIETEWGQKYSFPIILISHDSYDSLPIKCNWESKSMVAKEIFDEYGKNNTTFIKAYKKCEWQLTRFDTGAYWLDQL